jgi:hypothetical protein
VDKALLNTAFTRTAADLPSGLSITINSRHDIMDRMEAATAGEQGGVYPASAVNGNIRQHINSLNQQWVGEVEGAPGPLSVAVLVMGDDNTVHGNIRFYDSQVNRIRSFKVSRWQLMMAGCSCMSNSLK